MASTEETTATTGVLEVVLDAPMEVKAVTDENGGKSKKSKAKKVSTVKKSPSHPPYLEMITEAITTLKERNGSSQYAIQKFIEEKQKQLPSNFRKLLLTNLKKFVASGKLVKVKGSFKLPSKSESISTTKPKPATTTKPQPKSTASKLKSKSVAAKPKVKAKTAEKSKLKAKPAAPKAVAKPSVGSKRKASTEVKPKAKVAKTIGKSTPSKKTVAKSVKKAVPAKKASTVKSVKSKSVKSPAKRAMPKRGKK